MLYVRLSRRPGGQWRGWLLWEKYGWATIQTFAKQLPWLRGHVYQSWCRLLAQFRQFQVKPTLRNRFSASYILHRKLYPGQNHHTMGEQPPSPTLWQNPPSPYSVFPLLVLHSCFGSLYSHQHLHIFSSTGINFSDYRFTHESTDKNLFFSLFDKHGCRSNL